MADRASATILIGGVLPPELIDPFLGTIALERGFDGWEEAPVDAGAFDREAPLEVCGYELAGGVFEQLEAFCVEHRLAFVRSSGSCPGAFGPERVIFDDDGPLRRYAVDEDDRVVIDRSMLEALGSLEAVRAYFDAAEFTPPPLSRSDGGRPQSLT